MAATGKFGLQPDFDDIQSQSDTKHPSTKTEDIGIVVFSTQPGGETLMTEGGANVTMPVRSNRHADAGSAHENASGAASVFDGFADPVRELGIIDRFFGEATQIDDDVARLFEQVNEFLFESESAVITSKCNVHAQSSGCSY